MSNRYEAVFPPRYFVVGSTLVHKIETESREQAQQVATGLRALGYLVSIETVHDLELQPPLELPLTTPIHAPDIQSNSAPIPAG